MSSNSETILSVEDLRKSFGGIAATDGVSIEVTEGETHAIIGPNGAGKTTLLAQLSGMLMPDAGRVVFQRRDITRLPAHRRARLGIARSFQITSVFMDLTVLDNVAFAVQARQGHSFHFWTPARSIPTLREPAMEYLDRTGLAARRHETAGVLSHGERRQLEIAMALAGEPRLMLLDEPMAGMGAEETARMIDLLKSLSGRTILLVEHDMDAVFSTADKLSVLVNGHIIATDSVDNIRGNVEVQKAYLGDGHA
jgi:branched-chain amino acid transport system ATP-binding protein